MSKGVGQSSHGATASGGAGTGDHLLGGKKDGFGKDSVKVSTSVVPATLMRNPFYVREGGRNNFPDLDLALRRELSPTNHPLGRCDHVVNDDDEVEDDEGSSILNMSIGARASLNEHLRYVERFGIDGEKASSSSTILNSTGTQDGETITDSATQILDDHWESLLNSSRIDSSSSVIGVTRPLHLSRHDNPMVDYPGLATEDSIEVLADTSLDFFNSSRVKLLATPERQKNRRLDMVMTREGVYGGGVSFDNSLYGSDAGSSYCCLATKYVRDQHSQCSDHYRGTLSEIAVNTTRDDDRNSSFQSFNVAELSRISNTCSDVHRTPDTSFQHTHYLSVDHVVRTISPTIGRAYSPMRSIDSSLKSIPNRRDLSEAGLDGVYDENFTRFTATTTAHRIEGKGRVVTNERQRRGTKPKESVSPESNTSNSVHSAVSSIIAEAHSLMKNIANEVELSMGALESFPSDFLKAIDIVGRPSDPPSPISQVGSTTSSSQERSTSKSSGERGARNERSTPPNDPLAGRKRFRTVVPRRVYFDTGTTTPDEEQDSFFAVHSNPESGSVKKSLLESFEGALRHTF